MSRRHRHDTVLTKMRHKDRTRKPKPQNREQFTYGGVKVAGVHAFVFFQHDRPIFRQPIKCEREQALTLVRRLNGLPQTLLEQNVQATIQKWTDEIGL